MKYFELGEQDDIQCEVCGKIGRIDHGGFDCHHIIARSHGGSDEIENICLLCRKCHNAAHGIGKTYLHPDVMQAIHNNYLTNKKLGEL